MTSPLDQSEVDALMAAIQDGRVGAEKGEAADIPVVPYDLTSQDRIIRGQMPTLDSINDRIASMFGSNLGGRTRLDLRAAPSASTLMKFSDVAALFGPGNTVWIVSLGPGHGLAVLMVEATLCRSLLAGALGDRKARPEAGMTDIRPDLTNVERRVLRNLLGIFCEAMAVSWAEVLPFKPEVIRFESDPRMAMVAPPSDLAILCSYEISGAATGRLQIAIPYATVEPVKKSLTSPPRQGSSVDVRFASALAKEMEAVRVQVRVEMGRTRINFSKLLELQLGDLLVLDAAENSPLPVYVQGRPKMVGAPRVVGGSMAVVLENGLAGSKRPDARPHTDSSKPGRHF
ncbi:MAG: flagellar motor switch protein FliM [Myxococcales bacterium]|jgi:flagellar motor switch protein FliM|nr:flagellar motor switch protein FliM [Myxococcales bacterium]